MQRASRFSLLCSCAIAGLAAMAATVARVAETVTVAIGRMADMVGKFLLSIPAAFADNVRTWRATHGPSLALVRADHYHRRQVEREKPVVRPMYRSCPSI